jgi:hypothetical protein
MSHKHVMCDTRPGSGLVLKFYVAGISLHITQRTSPTLTIFAIKKAPINFGAFVIHKRLRC